MPTIKVKAADGLRVPKEGHPHDYIEQEEAEVPNTLYYHRLIADGDLIVTTDDATKAVKGKA